jgi:hypothetical protein
VIERANSVGDFKMKWDAFIFSNIINIFIFHEYRCEDVGRSISSTSSPLLKSVDGSETLDRSNVSGKKKQRIIPRVMNPTPRIMGMKAFFFSRYQANGTPMTVETKEAAIT